MTTYSVIGLGKLGASMAAGIARRGFPVIGVDINPAAVEAVNNGLAPVQETDLAATIAANQQRITATTSFDQAIHNSQVTFVVIPTPSDERGAFSLEYAAQAFRQIGRALATKTDYHLVVLTSTVLPGSTRFGLLPLLVEESGKEAGRDFGLCYSPEFIALGSVIRDFLNPDFNLVGELDRRSGDLLEASYTEIMENSRPCKRMSIENAELAKIALNTFVTTKITFANMLADLCEHLPGGDVDMVTDALGFDRRIGHPYLRGAIGYGGPCFPRDNVALSFIAEAMDTRAPLAEVTDEYNRHLPSNFAGWLHELVRPGSTVAILGLAYKPYSHVLEESQGVALAQSLASAGCRVLAFDPLADKMSPDEVGQGITIVSQLRECLEEASMVVITTPDPAFKELEAADFTGTKGRETIIIDFWRLLSKELAGREGIQYIAIGRSRNDEANAARLSSLWSPTATQV